MEPVIRELIERSAADTRRHIDELTAQVARGLRILDSELPKLRAEIEQLRQDMQSSTAELRHEMQDSAAELQRGIQSSVAELRHDIEESADESRQIGVLAEEVRDQLRFVAEGHMGLDAKLSGLHASFGRQVAC